MKNINIESPNMASSCVAVTYESLTDFDVLSMAYTGVRGLNKAAGVDGVTFQDIESQTGGRDTTLKEIQRQLLDENYTPSPLKRVPIPKPGGGIRPLGIPTIHDRIVQRAITNGLMPAVDPFMHEYSFAYRPGRSAQMAVHQVMKNLQEGYTYVIDADIARFFDSLPHRVIINILYEYGIDKKLIRLNRKFLKAPIIVRSKRGQYREVKVKSGTPQGGVISPLLANMCLNKFDWHITSMIGEYDMRIVRYADDFLVMSKTPLDLKSSCWLEQIERYLKRKLGLKLNYDKTSVRNALSTSFSYLGFKYSFEVNETGARFCCYPNSGKVMRLYDELDKISKTEETDLSSPQDKVEQAIRNWESYYGIYAGKDIAQEMRSRFG